MLELHAIFKGVVQGVGFRWTVVSHAEKYHLNGTVQNLANGSVEVYAHGSRTDLEAFLHAVQSEPGFAKIHSIQTTYKNSTTVFHGFSIL